MTDNEIKKALGLCKNSIGKRDCKKCAYLATKGMCIDNLLNDTLDLINRQQAEIERLKETQCTEKCRTETLELFNIKDTEIEKLKKKVMNNDKISTEYPHCVLLGKGAILTKSLEDYDKLLAYIADGAITEFAERLKALYRKNKPVDEKNAHTSLWCLFGIIDTLVKEMVGEDNG